MSDRNSKFPLIAHVVYRFDYGGLENGLVNLINATQGESFRHCVIALTEATEFRSRLRVPDVDIYQLGKKPGKDFGDSERYIFGNVPFNRYGRCAWKDSPDPANFNANFDLS